MLNQEAPSRIPSKAWKAGMALLLLAHLTYVLCGAIKRPPPSFDALRRWVSYYVGFSGAHYSWGFFAPNIGSEFKTEFEIRFKDGRTKKMRLGSQGPNEVLLREAGISATFWYGMRDEKIRRSLTASWAAAIFSQYPDAERVEVAVSAVFMPSMRQIREGQRTQWLPVYSAAYEKSGKAS